MAGERTIPILPCRQLDDVLPFYTALGFTVTYRQQRPNPYAAVRREDLHLHFFGLADFDPEQSMGSAIVLVPDPDALHRAFADGLRAAYGKVPIKGIPRLLRPRRKQGTVRGFTVVDPGGNWLRVSRAGDEEERAAGEKSLARVLEVAARQGDSHGDEHAAIAILDRGLARYPDAPPAEREEALLYRAELAIRTGDGATARSLLDRLGDGEATAELRRHLQDSG
jgi:hypothetical protein